MPASTFPTRSAPTSAALVKMPPPTRMNMASRAPPNPKPSRTIGAVSRNSSSASAAPKSPRPTVIIPTTPPVRNADREGGRVPAGGRRSGDPHVPPGGQRHPDEPDRGGETGADQEEHRAPEAGAEPAVGHRQEQEEQEDDDGEDRQRAELPSEIGPCSLLDRPRYLLHRGRSLVGREHGADQPGGEGEG